MAKRRFSKTAKKQPDLYSWFPFKMFISGRETLKQAGLFWKHVMVHLIEIPVNSACICKLLSAAFCKRSSLFPHLVLCNVLQGVQA